MFCKNCGNNLSDNAAVCDRCGAVVSEQPSNPNYDENQTVLSKQQYFKSRMITDKAKSMRTGCKVIFGINTALSVLAILGLALVLVITSAGVIDFTDGFVSGLKKIEAESGIQMYSESDWEVFEEMEVMMEQELGTSFAEFWKTLPIRCIISIVALIAMFVVSLIAITKINTGCAIAFTVLSVLFSGWLVIAAAVAILIMTIQLNKEYTQYSENSSVFSGLNGNEPDFR